MSQPGTNLELNTPRNLQTLTRGGEEKHQDQDGEEIQGPIQHFQWQQHLLPAIPLDAQHLAHPTRHHTLAGAQTN